MPFEIDSTLTNETLHPFSAASVAHRMPLTALLLAGSNQYLMAFARCNTVTKASLLC